MRDIFAFTDIHGEYNLYKAIMDYCKQQDSESTIIFLGDACDRGPKGYQIMNELLDDPYVIYLKGNHEDIFVEAAREINQHFNFTNKNKEYIISCLAATKFFPEKYPNIVLSLYNGGINTLTDWILDGQPLDFIEKIDKLPLTFSYEQFDFCHAGGAWKAFQRVSEAEYYNKPIDSKDKENLLWDRTQDVGWETGRICVFGHTPTIYLRTKYYGKDKSVENIHPCAWIGDFYTDKYQGWRIDMDTGAVQSGKAFVFNVLLNDTIGFEKKGDKVEIF